jgi:hypothetical protein
MMQRAFILLDRKFQRGLESVDEVIHKLNKKIDWENGNLDWKIMENCMKQNTVISQSESKNKSEYESI